jgi:hypothetical protein
LDCLARFHQWTPSPVRGHSTRERLAEILIQDNALIITRKTRKAERLWCAPLRPFMVKVELEIYLIGFLNRAFRMKTRKIAHFLAGRNSGRVPFTTRELTTIYGSENFTIHRRKCDREKLL